MKIFTVLWGKNIIFEKGGGAKILYFGQIYTPAYFYYFFLGNKLRNQQIRTDVPQAKEIQTHEILDAEERMGHYRYNFTLWNFFNGIELHAYIIIINQLINLKKM